MSVNYHAYQSRGVLFEEYEVVCQQWREEFSEYKPERIAKILHLETDQEYLYLTYFRCPYRLRLRDGVLEKEVEEQWTDKLYFNEAMSLYHLLHYTKDLPVVSGKWVPSHTIDGVVSRNPAVKDPLLSPFETKYNGKIESFKKACLLAGGEALEIGDVQPAVLHAAENIAFLIRGCSVKIIIRVGKFLASLTIIVSGKKAKFPVCF